LALAHSSGTLLSRSILKELGLRPAIPILANSQAISMAGAVMGLAVFLGVSGRRPFARTLGAALLVQAAGLAVLPWLRTEWLFYASMFVAGAAICVTQLAGQGFWPQSFGRAHLGQILSVVHVSGALAAATGPLVLWGCQALLDSYVVFFFAVAPAVAALGAATLCVRLPDPARNPPTGEAKPP
jgi:hypothetical protein